MGVSRYAYRSPLYQLQYAAKDAEGLLDLLQQGQGKTYSNVYTLPLLDENATREKILAARDFVSKAGVDDVVVVFFASHGMLDANANFYFATVDMDFSSPSRRGLTFQALDELLDGIAARHRLLLIDACHSGEVDSGATKISNGPASKAKARAFGDEATFRNSDSFQLLSSLFSDLRQHSGTSVIAASRGVEKAYEPETLQHGLFTYAILEGLREHKAGNGDITISQLLDYVSGRVSALSQGLQSPAARQTNLEDDFVLWR